MKGVKLDAPWKIGVVELDMPQAKPGFAIVKIKAAGICGSDIGAYRGANPMVSYPRVIGHELAGEVVEIGDNPKGIKAGDHVILDPYIFCGKCYPCTIGRTNCCENLKVLGVQTEGGMAEYFSHPANLLVKVPADMPWELVPLAEPVTIAIHGLHRSKLAKGEHIIINGAGPIGLLAAMAAIHYGAVPIMIDLVQKRLDLAKKLGVKHTLNLGSDDVPARVKEITNGRMAEVVMEASGANSAIQAAFDLVSFAGRVILTGWPKEPTLIDTAKITKKELDVRGARVSVGEFEEAIDLIHSGKVDAKAILSHVINVSEAPATVAAIDKNPGDYLKVNVMF